MKVINLISGPRNISTALMYSFAQRKDFEVLDEPFYGYYLKQADLAITHPSHMEIIHNMEVDEQSVVDYINDIAKETNIFIKGMAHHFLSDEPEYLSDWENVVLVRHPRKLISSFSKVISNPTLADIGIKKASELVTYLNSIGKAPVVIDSDELMINPEAYLVKLCDLLHIGFDPCMLSWKKGGIPQDGIWARHWYKKVHQTTGFEIQQKKPAEVPPHLGPLLAEALPFYESLQPYILKNE
ncbi:MAG: sulfotransferase family protein [Bacteroidia bacterium]|nr:sulfotransferase family protein [Bacteroidia bacterium]NNF30463.1 sulfotransferase family protein [Flavobacteriaceae bacterium]MBT8275204.1 sulfotransferase family protein [Bacteroidia bacterium]NNJ80667.1 sulfotransferase family protein [Flavobacteriaceae bacterium]NNK53915.1 sulfotransferase family protein [Flavobacteriaceae bacterium]